MPAHPVVFCGYLVKDLMGDRYIKVHELGTSFVTRANEATVFESRANAEDAMSEWGGMMFTTVEFYKVN